jgi:6-pyruvoyltetrahydropterin/6-carboxytetrahydropterin synthase
LSPEENRGRFGKWASPFNHGHNYVLDVTVCGKIDPVHGMVANIKRLDDLLQERVVQRLDQRSLSDEVAEFADSSPTLENLVVWIHNAVFEGRVDYEIDGAEVEVSELRLEESPTLWVSYRTGTRTMTLIRSFEFAASHRLHVDGLSDAENVALFGKCHNAAGHGHNYGLVVAVEGKPSEETGMLVDIERLDETVLKAVIDRYDHKNLSVDLPEFAEKNATSEVVAAEIFRRLEAPIAALGVELVRIRLEETARNAFEVCRS